MKLSIIIPVFNQEELVIKALDSIPTRNDIEIIVINDGSTDNTKNVLDHYQANSNKNIRLFHLKENKGVAYAKNIGYDNATGEYLHEIDSDDYVFTNEYIKLIDELDGTDIIYTDLVQNNGTILKLTEKSKYLYCGFPCKFVKRSLLGNSRCPDVKTGEDWYLNNEIQAKPHTEKYTGIVSYHYNFPRERKSL